MYLLYSRLKELRQKRGMNQAELAELVCVSPSAISNYETGLRVPDAYMLIALADCFAVSADYLLGRTEVP